MDSLEKARKKIDTIDQQMAALFEERMQAVTQVAQYKMEHKLPILDGKREAAVLEKNCAYIQNEPFLDYYADFMQYVMELAKQYQKTLLNHDKVGYQGTEGAFSHIALRHLFKDEEIKAYATFEDVFQAVEANEIAYGVIPFENSYTGEVGEVLDLLLKYDCFIQQMYDLKINQNLLGCPGATIKDIKQVYSHHQALSQCQQFLQSNDFAVIPYPNTALAAKFVSEQKDNSKAAIASKETAQIYGLHVLVENINTSMENTTRFIVIGKKANPSCGDRFSLLFTVDHTVGQLAKVMQLIGDYGFNVESIKSRPLHHAPWQYYFYAQIVGDLADEKAVALVQNLQKVCKELKVLGAYTIQKNEE